MVSVSVDRLVLWCAEFVCCMAVLVRVFSCWNFTYSELLIFGNMYLKFKDRLVVFALPLNQTLDHFVTMPSSFKSFRCIMGFLVMVHKGALYIVNMKAKRLTSYSIEK